jgi:predicted Zn-dependent protease with MMP-like domain/curved DNA-binding protein CbpA
MASVSRSDPSRGDERDGGIGVSVDASSESFDDSLGDSRNQQGRRPADDEPDSHDAPDLYARLGVTPDIGPDDLRRAYHRLVKLWHPDRYVGAPPELRERAERRMRQLNEAYGTLSDPLARAAYDRQREGRANPIGDVINVFGQRSAAPTAPADAPFEDHASANPNGAGQFFGMLAAILALALIGGAISGAGLGSGVGALIVLVGIVALLLAAAFFVTDSPFSKMAFRLMESDPRGTPRQPRRPQPPPHRPTQPPPASQAERPTESGEIDPATFEALIAEALAAVPHNFDQYLRNVVVRSELEPDVETLKRAGVPEGHTLLGLYTGVSMTRRGASEVGPEVITIYRGPITRYCQGDLARIRAQVRATVLHELAHHFGIDHDDMPEWVK